MQEFSGSFRFRAGLVSGFFQACFRLSEAGLGLVLGRLRLA